MKDFDNEILESLTKQLIKANMEIVDLKEGMEHDLQCMGEVIVENKKLKAHIERLIDENTKLRGYRNKG